jgi:GNAT superfamily N-acetyltransferase
MTLFLPAQIVDEQAITPEMDAAIRAGLCECFPPDREVFSQTRAWHGSFPTWSVVIEQAGVVIAHAAVVEREILAGDQTVRVAGVQNVFVLPAYRGQGLCRQVMTAAMDHADLRGLDLGLLFCAPQISPPYVEHRRITRIDELGQSQPLPKNNVALFYPLRLGGLPAGDLHLQGNDW